MKAEAIFDGLCYSCEPLIVILVHTPNSATWSLAIIRHMREQCKPGALSPPPPLHLGTRIVAHKLAVCGVHYIFIADLTTYLHG